MRDTHFTTTLGNAQPALRNPHSNNKISNMKTGEKIRQIRQSKNLTISEVENKAGISEGNLSRVERGLQWLSEEKLFALANALGCAVSDLFSENGTSVNVVATPMGGRRIPLIDYVRAGHMAEVADPYVVGDAEEWLQTDLTLSSNAFALKVKGDSMTPEFREGDVVIIDPSVEPLPGDFVVAKNSSEEATFKKYRPRGVGANGEMVFELVPLNEDYPSLKSDISSIRVIGTMIEHRKYRRR